MVAPSPSSPAAPRQVVTMLDQLGLADSLAQQCFACRETVNYDKYGNEVEGRGWAFMQNMKDTKWDFALVLRQKYQEEVFRKALAREGVQLDAPYTLVGIEVIQGVEMGGHRVLATIEHGSTKTKSVVKCRYLVGADGGRSFVRRAMNIPFDGSSSEDKWVRVDGVIETDLPKPRTYCAIESPTHGNVLWAALDRGATRIGFAFTTERQKAYKVFDEAAAVQEAIASVKPFNLSFKQVDWWTIYVVGQRIARSFFVNDSIFLAGDACHTHSSGAAQGMNTGMHDAVNLGWKLSLVLRGLARPDLLHSYEAERLPNVQRLINYDKDISRLMTMQLPEGWTGDPNADPNEILGVVMAEAATFSSGLGIYYEPDSYLNLTQTSGVSSVQPGQRAPDVRLQKPATFEYTRLQTETPNTATFYVVLFAGEVVRTKIALESFTAAIKKLSWLSDSDAPLSCLSIIAGPESATTFEVIDLPLAKEIQDEISPLRETFLDCNLIFPFEENKTLTTGRLLCSQSKDTILLATPEHSRPYLYLLLKSFETTGNQRRWQGVFVHEDEREWQGRLKTLAYHRLESSSETSTTATDSFDVFALFVRDIVMQYITSVTSEAEALMIMIRRVQDLLRPNRSERLSDLLREINAISYQLRISSLETQFAFSADAAKWTKDAFRPFKNEKSDYEVFISVRRMQQYHPDLLREMIAEVRQQIVDVAAEEKQAKEELRQKQEEERQKQEDAHQKRRQMQDDERATNEGRLLAESIRIAEETQRDSRTMRGIAWVTIAFLPATFVSSFFGMNFFNGIAGNVPFDEASRNVWLFFVVAVPVSAIVLSTFYFWDRHEQMNDDRKLKESKDDYELRLIGRRWIT
ncbi:uncharacterized protein AALT_g4652 [Alternaria alternata]|nr:uncharacterized protein AALT_g4652 [Alternaria alternata]